jgi:hypothetical protein
MGFELSEIKSRKGEIMNEKYRELTSEEIRHKFDSMTNAEILNQYPVNIPLRIASIIMRIADSDMRYGIEQNSERFKFGVSVKKKNKNTYKIDTALFLKTIPQREGK